MASLPQGWESDYDGNRWFFRYKPTGAVQYMFPKEGDEFSVYHDNFWSVPSSFSPTPDESREGGHQRHTSGLSTHTPSGTRNGKENNSNSSATLSRSDFLSASSFDMFGGFLGPASFSDVSPVDEDEEVTSMPTAAQEVDAKTASDTADSLTVSSTTTSYPEAPKGAVEIASGLAQATDAVEIHELPDASTLGGRHYASDPVGNISELATEQTLHCEDELAPVELDGGPVQIQPGRTEPAPRLTREPNIASTESTSTPTTPLPYTPDPSTAQVRPPSFLPTTSEPQTQVTEAALASPTVAADPNASSSTQKESEAAPQLDQSTPSYHPFRSSILSALPSGTTTADVEDNTGRQPDVNAKAVAAASARSNSNPTSSQEEQRQATHEAIQVTSTAPVVLSPHQVIPDQATPPTQQTPAPPAASALASYSPLSPKQTDLDRVPSILQPASKRATQAQALLAPTSNTGLVLSDVPLALRPANNATFLSTTQLGDSHHTRGHAEDSSAQSTLGEIDYTKQALATFSTNDKVRPSQTQSDLMPAPLRLSRQASPSSPTPSVTMPSYLDTRTDTSAVVSSASFDAMNALVAVPASTSPQSPPAQQTLPFTVDSLLRSESYSEQEHMHSTVLSDPASTNASGYVVGRAPAASTPITTQSSLAPDAFISANFARIDVITPQPAPIALPAAISPPGASVINGNADDGVSDLSADLSRMEVTNEQPWQAQASIATTATPSPKSLPADAPGRLQPAQQKRFSVVQRKAVGRAAAAPAGSVTRPISSQSVAVQSSQLANASTAPAPSPSPAPSMTPSTSTLPHRPSVSSVSSQSSQNGGAFLPTQRAPSATQSTHGDYRTPNQGASTPQQMQPSPASSFRSMYSPPALGAPLVPHPPTDTPSQPGGDDSSAHAFAEQPPAGQHTSKEPAQTSIAAQAFPGTLPQPGTNSGNDFGTAPQHRMSLPSQLPSQQAQQSFFPPPPLAMGGNPPPLPNRVATPGQSGQAGQAPPLATSGAPSSASTPGATPGTAPPIPGPPSTGPADAAARQFPHLQHAQTMPATLSHNHPPHPHPAQSITPSGYSVAGQPFQPGPGQPVSQPMAMGPNGVPLPSTQAYPYLAAPAQMPQPPQAQAYSQAYVPAAYIPGTSTAPVAGANGPTFAAGPTGNIASLPTQNNRPVSMAMPPRPEGTTAAPSSSSSSGLFSKLLKNPAVKRTAFAIGGALVGESIGLSGAAGARLGTSAYSSHQQYKRQSAQQAAIESAVQKAQANAAAQAQQQILAAQQQAAGGRPPLYSMHTAPGQLQQNAPPRMPGVPAVPQPYIPGQPATGQTVPVQTGRPAVPTSFSAPPGQVRPAPGVPYIPGQTASPGTGETPGPAPSVPAGAIPGAAPGFSPGSAPGAAPGPGPGSAPGAAPGAASGSPSAGYTSGTVPGPDFHQGGAPGATAGAPPSAAFGTAAGQDRATSGRPHGTAGGRGYTPNQRPPGAAGMPPGHAAGRGRGAGPMPGAAAGPAGAGRGAPSNGEQLANTVINSLLHAHQQSQQQDPYSAILHQQQQQQNAFMNILNQSQQQQQNAFTNLFNPSQQTTFGFPTVAPAPVPVFDMNTNTQIDIDVTNNFTFDDNSGLGNWGSDTGDFGGDTGDFGGDGGFNF
ncbi:hypothetical protein SEPCBS119000_003135 [Sporothrix epigloea]|uniref:WW domain-containing protein n=1 Tax=Sporothrix epigloea TaxID=1892477 RepID=A0ABP0DK01_9PEZI